jgi:hypothetical protein
MITGGCLCAGVRYAIHAAPSELQICHCRSCRKAQGGPLAANMPVAAADFELRSGADLLRDYESSPGKHRLFCRVCGSPIISRRDDAPEAVRVRAGTLDGDPGARPASQAFVADAAPWWPVDTGLPAYAGARPK